MAEKEAKKMDKKEAKKKAKKAAKELAKTAKKEKMVKKVAADLAEKTAAQEKVRLEAEKAVREAEEKARKEAEIQAENEARKEKERKGAELAKNAAAAKKSSSDSESSSSTSSDSSSGSEKNKVPPPQAKGKKVAKKVSSSSGSSSSSSSDDSEDNADPIATKKGSPNLVVKKVYESSSDGDSSGSDADENEGGTSLKPSPMEIAAPTTKTETKEENSDSSSSSSDSGSDDDDDDDDDDGGKKEAQIGKVEKGKSTEEKTTDDSTSSSDETSSSEAEAGISKLKARGKISDDMLMKGKKRSAEEDDGMQLNDSARKKVMIDGVASVNRKVFVRGLPWKTGEGEIQDFFQSCGAIENLELPLMNDGRSSGTAILGFESLDGVNAAIKMDGSTFGERWLSVSLYEAKPEASGTPTKITSTGDEDMKKQVFVKGLPWRASEDEVREFFQSCDAIEIVELPLSDDGRASGTAIIEFASSSGADAAVAMDGANFGERWLNIRYNSPNKPVGTSPRLPSQKEEGCTTVFMGNLSWNIDEASIREVFSECGTVKEVSYDSILQNGHIDTYKVFTHEFVRLS